MTLERLAHVAAIVAVVLSFLMFLYAHPIAAGILLVIAGIIVVPVALYTGMSQWRRLLYVAFSFLVFGVGLCLMITGFGYKIPPPREEHPKEPEKIIYDFESDTQDWGEHPQNARHVSGQGVDVNRAILNTGASSLKFTPMNIKDRNAYVTVLKDAQRYKITAHIYVKSDADVSLPQAGSTAKIIVWDKNWASHESDYVEIEPDGWQSIIWDVREEQWPGPWREFGIHFWFATDYKGPIYIDTVTLEK